MLLTFSKNERLHLLREIKTLFSGGRNLVIKPLKITWLLHDQSNGSNVKLMVSFPKVLCKKATLRNRIKRRLREAYRLNKNILHDIRIPHGKSLLVCITYTSKELLSYSEIQDKIILILSRLKEECGKVV
jgi:ribonuclease P protein component